MTMVFIAGSRRMNRLDARVTQRLDRIVDRQLPVVIGDANGADRAVQTYLHTRGHALVEVFCSGASCRNNVGDFPVRQVPVPRGGPSRGFGFYALKDRAMAEQATVGLMLWDGESFGTLMNVERLVRFGKPAAVYVAPKGEFVDVKTDAAWEHLLAGCSAPLRSRVESEREVERVAALPPRQVSLV